MSKKFKGPFAPSFQEYLAMQPTKTYASEAEMYKDIVGRPSVVLSKSNIKDFEVDSTGRVIFPTRRKKLLPTLRVDVVYTETRTYYDAEQGCNRSEQFTNLVSRYRHS